LTGRPTVFTAGKGRARYSFHVRRLAGFLLDGAEVRDAGWDLGNPGLVVERDPSSSQGELLVFDSDFHDNFVGLTLREFSGTVLASRFHDNKFVGIDLDRSPATLALLAVHAQAIGVVLGSGSNARLRGLQVYSNDVGIRSRDSSPELDHSILSSNGSHARFERSGDAIVHDNVFLFALDTAVSTVQGATARLEHNDLVENSFGMKNEDGAFGQPILALNNYWGAPSGPGGLGPGDGDRVSAGVLFSPWCTSTCVREESD
jgi:hypothetical protein